MTDCIRADGPHIDHIEVAGPECWASAGNTRAEYLVMVIRACPNCCRPHRRALEGMYPETCKDPGCPCYRT